jgi:hypothetical protein
MKAPVNFLAGAFLFVVRLYITHLINNLLDENNYPTNAVTHSSVYGAFSSGALQRTNQ